MVAIERNIFVLCDEIAVAHPIDYVQGTNALPIIFHFRDYEIPEGAEARIYIIRPSGKAEYDLAASINDNSITIDVKDTMFAEVGRTYIQILIKYGEKTLATFMYPVDVKKNNVAGEIPESENRSNFIDEYIEKIDIRIEQAQSLAEEAIQAADTANTSKEEAKKSENNAAVAETNSQRYAIESESFAHGGTGTRENEDTDNAMYYFQQAKDISKGMNGLIPMGTITYDELSNADNQVDKFMFNISNAFTTDDTFREGAGHEYPAGVNVYRTSDGYWDCLAGNFVAGVKGAKEQTYRQGNVNITAENIGALAEDGDSKENSISFSSNDSTEVTEWTDVEVIKSGEKHISLFEKISTMFKNIRWIYKMLGTTDISDIGDGTCTGALSTINTDLSKIGVGFKVLQSSQYPLSIGDNTLRFGVAEWNDNCFSNDTFTAKNKGRYNFHALMQFIISEETRVAVFFKVNGVSVAYTTDELISFNQIVSSDMYCNLNVGDTVQLCVYTNKSASLQNGFSFVGELIKPL